jgi:WD40 repeat protein
MEGGEARKLQNAEYDFTISRLDLAGGHLIAGCRDGVLRMIDVETGRHVRDLYGTAPAKKKKGFDDEPVFITSSVANRLPTYAVSPDGRTVAIKPTGDTRSVVLLEMATLKTRQVCLGHPGSLMSLGFSNDGRHLVTAGADGSLFVWRIAAPEKTAKPLPAEQLDQMWKDLGSDDAIKALAVIRMLVANPKEGVAFLKERFKPAEAAKLEAILSRPPRPPRRRRS